MAEPVAHLRETEEVVETKQRTNIELASQQIRQWQDRINQLYFDIFANTEKGKELLHLWEQGYILSRPTLEPGKDRSWGDHNEGRNTFIRSVRAGIYQHMYPIKSTKVERKTDGN